VVMGTAAWCKLAAARRSWLELEETAVRGVGVAEARVGGGGGLGARRMAGGVLRGWCS